MNTMLISLGLEQFKPPRDYSHLKKINIERKDDTWKRLNEVMRDMLMSTSDIAKRLGVERATVARYMSKRMEEGDVERIGQTIHPESNVRVDVWRIKCTQ